MSSALHSLYRIAISVFVTAVLVGQSIVTFAPIFGESFGMRFWPIISYAMYTRAHFEGDTVEVYELLEGTLRDGSIVEIPMESLGLGIWYYRNLVKGLKKEDPVAIDMLIDRYRWGDELTEIRIKSYPLMVTRNGPAEKPSEIRYHLTIPNRQPAEQ